MVPDTGNGQVFAVASHNLLDEENMSILCNGKPWYITQWEGWGTLNPVGHPVISFQRASWLLYTQIHSGGYLKTGPNLP